MANPTTQVEYKFNGEAHYFIGRDRLSSGVFVANKEFKEALSEMKKQLKNSLESNDVRGTPKNMLNDADLEKAIVPMGHVMTLWKIDIFG